MLRPGHLAGSYSGEGMSEKLNLEAYCVKCKTKREMGDLTPVFTAKGQPAVQGTCPVCGTKMFRMGSLE